MREIEGGLTEPYPVVISLETSDGGKPGMVCEVPRSVAAKMILEGRATLASVEQKELFLQQQETAKKTAEKAELARRLQVAIIADPDLQTTSIKAISKK
jgi:hypothetical protein